MGSHRAPGSSDDIRAALDAFRTIVQALRTSSREIEGRLGLTTAQLFALQQLAAVPGASINELAARTFTHQSSVSVVVQRLVKRRLVVKVAALEDRRRVRLKLTEAGRALLSRSPEPVQEKLIAGIAALTPTQRRQLASVLNEVAGTMGAITHRPPMLFEEEEQRRKKLGRR
jgi:DNA-binding MarR family transcriptional regulator